MSRPGGADAAPVGELSVDDSWAEVVRTAYLLTADHGTAEELAAAAFAEQRRRRLPSSPTDLRRLVLTLPSSLSGRLVTGSWLAPEPADPFVAAYRRLPSRRRALLVLRVGEGLDGRAAAEILGLRPQDAHTSTVAALDALRAALPAADPPGGADGAPGATELDLGEFAPSPPGNDAVPVDLPAADPVVQRLAALFAELSGAPPVVADPSRLVNDVAARARGRRRRFAVVAAGLVVALVGSGALVARLHAGDLAEQHRAERRRAAEAALSLVVDSGDVTTWPTRGDLAGRADLLAQVRTIAAAAGAVLAVPFFGRVGGKALALVVSRGTEDDGRTTRRLLALVGPVDRPVGSWERVVDMLDPDGPDDLPVPVLSAMVASGDGRVGVVAVTVSRGVSVAVSTGPRVDASGVPSRRYFGLLLRNGVGTASWSGDPAGTLLRVQYRDTPPSFGGASIVEPQPQRPPPVPLRRRILARSCGEAGFQGLRGSLDEVAREAAAQLGLGAEQVAQAQEVGCRQVADHAVAVVALRLVDGTALQAVAEEIRLGGGATYPGADVRAVPRGREATYPSVVALYDDGSSSPTQRRMVLFCAPGGATAELVPGSSGSAGQALATAHLGPDGLGVGIAAAALADLLRDEQDRLWVVVRDAAGAVVERLPVPTGHALEPESPEGPVREPGAPAVRRAFPHRR